jgi:hypothetical protein
LSRIPSVKTERERERERELTFKLKEAKLSKTIPVTGPRGLQSYEMLKTPHCLDNGLTDGGKVVGLKHRPRSTPPKHYFSASGTHFC